MPPPSKPRRARRAAVAEAPVDDAAPGRPCGCGPTGRHRKTCELAGKGRAVRKATPVEDDDEDDAPPTVTNGKPDRFAAIEARAAARRRDAR